MQLFRDEETHSDKGYMQVTMDQPFYEPGATVTGTIFMRVTKPIQRARGIELEVKGGGKNSFWRFWTEMEINGGRSEIVSHEEKCWNKKKFMHFKDKVWLSPA